MKKYFLAGAMVLSLFAVQLAYADIPAPPTPTPIPNPLPVPIAQGSNVFTDVTPGSTYYDALLYLKNQGVIDGYPDGSFKPNDLINRAEFTKIVVGASRTSPDNGLCMEKYTQTATGDGVYANMFTDVLTKNHAWYLNDLCYAKDQHLIDGYPDGSFKPEKNINFVEAAKILDNAFGLAGEPQGGPWYKIYVDLLAFQKAIPTSIKSFDQKITRGEMAEMAYRLKSQNTSLTSQTYDNLQ